ncbi:hypothetical protein D3C86_1677280 [compost metagenome]
MTPPPVVVAPPLETVPPKVEPQLTIEKTEEEKKSDELVEQFGTYDPTLDLLRRLIITISRLIRLRQP